MIERNQVNPIRLENNGGCVGQINKYPIVLTKPFNQHTQIIIAHWTNIFAQPGAKQVD